jgi:hypothetical protein
VSAPDGLLEAIGQLDALSRNFTSIVDRDQEQEVRGMAVPVLDVRRTLTAAEGELHIGPPKSKAGMRNLLVPELVARALKRHHRPKENGSYESGSQGPSWWWIVGMEVRGGFPLRL